MGEGRCRHDESGDDLVADAEEDRGIKAVMREGDSGGERDDIAREEGELHPFAALSHTVAHRRDAARHLRRSSRCARGFADDGGEGLEGPVGREHVVVGGDDPEVGNVFALACDEAGAVGGVGPGDRVGEVAALEVWPGGAAFRRLLGPGEVGGPGLRTPCLDALGDGGEGRVERGGGGGGGHGGCGVELAVLGGA